jgi:hypothetical protein
MYKKKDAPADSDTANMQPRSDEPPMRPPPMRATPQHYQQPPQYYDEY